MEEKKDFDIYNHNTAKSENAKCYDCGIIIHKGYGVFSTEGKRTINIMEELTKTAVVVIMDRISNLFYGFLDKTTNNLRYGTRNGFYPAVPTINISTIGNKTSVKKFRCIRCHKNNERKRFSFIFKIIKRFMIIAGIIFLMASVHIQWNENFPKQPKGSVGV